MNHFDAKAIFQRTECLFDHQAIQSAIENIAQDISQDLSEQNPIVICILNGGLILTGQLLTQLNFPLQVDYLHASRYLDKTKGASLQWYAYPKTSLKDRCVLLVDDILDEGFTLVEVKKYCLEQGASKVKTVVLADKQHQRKASPNLKADYCGIHVPDEFIVGYGLDFKGYWRNAAGIFAIHKDDQHK